MVKVYLKFLPPQKKLDFYTLRQVFMPKNN